jgi:UDP-N-acetylglucosamine--dolichyl-phosphate N-acetylglucosaminephosphotransferase
MANQPVSTALSALSRTETVNLGALSIVCIAIFVRTLDADDGEPLIASLALSGFAFAATYAMIRWLGPTFIKAGMKGRDLSKVNNSHYLPECMGAICAIVYLLTIIVFIPFPFYKDIVVATSGGGNKDVVMNVEFVQKGRLLHKFPHSKVPFLSFSFLLSLYVYGISWIVTVTDKRTP